MNFLIIFIKIAVAIVVMLLAVMLLTLVERRLLAFIQDRLGPNRLGPQGLFQPVADAIKLVLKEDIVPADADKFLHALAPSIAVFLAVAAVLIIPVGDRMTIAGYDIHWVISDVGILYFLAASSIAIYAILLAGWGSSNKYSMYGALRSVAQMISYELSMGLAVVGAVLLWGSLSLSDMVRAQGLGNLKELVWFIMAMPLFGVFFITGLAETNRAPFDLPECESELVAGYHTEFSGLKFVMFFLAEYANVIVISAIAVTLFLGGWKGPGFWGLGDIPFIWFAMKTFALCWLFIWVRGTFPRLRYDQLMDFGWKLLFPSTLFFVMVVAVVVSVWP